MRVFLNEIKKYLYIYIVFAKNCLISQMEYRASFAMAFLSELVFLFLKVFYVIVIYRTEVNINGIPSDAMLIFGGVYIILTGIYTGILMMNFAQIPNYIRTGKLDMLITKPVSLQFIISLRYIDFGSSIPNMIVGIIMLVIGWSSMGIAAGVFNILGFILFMLSAALLSYAIFFVMQLLSFWFVKAESVKGISEVVWDYNNMPMSIYSKWMQKVGVFVLPLFIISNFPALFILNKLSAVYTLWAFIAPAIFIIIVRVVWLKAIKNYTSASS